MRLEMNYREKNVKKHKDMDWLNEYKNKTHIYAVYKRPTSDLETHID